MATYNFTFFRPYDVCRDGWVEYAGVGKVNYRIGMEFGPALLAKLMADMPDGDIDVTEVHAKVPLSHYLPSLHTLAAINDSLCFTLAMYKSLNNLTAWPNIDNKNDLLARGLVTRDGLMTDKGQQAIVDYETTQEKQTPNVVLTVNQREAFHVIVDSPEKWNDLHGKTQNLMINSGWVEMQGKLPVLTSLGNDIFKYVVSAPQIENDATPPSEATVRALVAVRDNSNAWGKIGPRMKGDLKARGFVVIESKDWATVNPARLQAIADHKPGDA